MRFSLAIWLCGLLLILEVAGASETWERNRQPLLTNFNNMYNPCVLETGGEYRYTMWFFGWAVGPAGNPGVPGCDAIFCARSKDLRTWEVFSQGETWDRSMSPRRWVPVLHASERWYEAWHVGDPSVVRKDGRFYMAYSATSKPFAPVRGYPADMVQCVMGAVSADGVHWKKADQPLLIRAQDTASPQPEPERIGDFHRPSLHWDRGQMVFMVRLLAAGQERLHGLRGKHGRLSATGWFPDQTRTAASVAGELAQPRSHSNRRNVPLLRGPIGLPHQARRFEVEKPPVTGGHFR